MLTAASLKYVKTKWLVCGFELLEGGLELFLRVLTDFGKEQHHEDVGFSDGLVVLVLQPSLRDSVEKVFPHDELEKDALADPILVLAIDEDLELLPVLFQFRGGGEK